MHRKWLTGLISALSLAAACGGDGTTAPATPEAADTTTTTLIDELYAPGSAAYDVGESIAGRLVRNGWRWDGPTGITELVESGEPIDDRRVSVTVVARGVPAVLLDKTGAPLDEQPPAPGGSRVRVELTRAVDGRWRISSVEVLELIE